MRSVAAVIRSINAWLTSNAPGVLPPMSISVASRGARLTLPEPPVLTPAVALIASAVRATELAALGPAKPSCPSMESSGATSAMDEPVPAVTPPARTDIATPDSTVTPPLAVAVNLAIRLPTESRRTVPPVAETLRPLIVPPAWRMSPAAASVTSAPVTPTAPEPAPPTSPARVRPPPPLPSITAAPFPLVVARLTVSPAAALEKSMLPPDCRSTVPTALAPFRSIDSGAAVFRPATVRVAPATTPALWLTAPSTLKTTVPPALPTSPCTAIPAVVFSVTLPPVARSTASSVPPLSKLSTPVTFASSLPTALPVSSTAEPAAPSPSAPRITSMPAVMVAPAAWAIASLAKRLSVFAPIFTAVPMVMSCLASSVTVAATVLRSEARTSSTPSGVVVAVTLPSGAPGVAGASGLSSATIWMLVGSISSAPRWPFGAAASTCAAMPSPRWPESSTSPPLPPCAPPRTA